jgi:hypothetical protein
VPVGPAENAPAPDAQARPDAAVADTPAADARPAEPAADDGATVAAPARDPENGPAAERRDDDNGRSVGTPRRGKKGEHDQEIERTRRRAANPDSGGPISRADDAGAPQARRVDSIFYRPRRAARRDQPRYRSDTDRLRRIFEGTPER